MQLWHRMKHLSEVNIACSAWKQTMDTDVSSLISYMVHYLRPIKTKTGTTLMRRGLFMEEQWSSMNHLMNNIKCPGQI